MNFNNLERLEDKISLMKQLSSQFLHRAAKVDESGSFSYENIKELKQSGYTTLPVPKEYGGKGITLLELVVLQETLAQGDGATALGIGWHMSVMKNLAENRNWSQTVFRELCNAVLNGALINSAASEALTGSPTRGGKPQTIARKDKESWVINGRKTFTTLSPVLDYFIVSASIEGSDDVGNFLIQRKCNGVSIEETWDSIAMRGTASHDLILLNVKVQEKDCVEILSQQKKANGSLLHIPACYLGIAQAAQNEALHFANTYSPNSISGKIIDLPNVQQKVGEMEYELIKARHLLYSVAQKWDETEEKETLLPELGVAKMAVTNSAISIVDLAMRIVGARSLSKKSPLQRYYRDVRAGLHNPPMDDMTIKLLSQKAIDRIQ
ncbi:acyl-CoA dehydrogenase family protein [Niallia sp. Krafla_26]|uniref:acyl-CoA dehydrogenase family protein n=1 Tax=Niallia sp. Krafla_26 TaxID=3064703 RepID=UPI003D175207